MDNTDSKMKIAIVVEGDEEEYLFLIAKETGHFNPLFNVEIINAGGEGSVPAFFHDCYSNPIYDCTVAVYDVDNKRNQDKSIYNLTKNKLENIVGNNVDAISFCTNPNILQIILLGCDTVDNVSLDSTAKTDNADIVSNYWPKIARKIKDGKQVKKGYDASKYQLEIIKNSFKYDEWPSYDYMTLLNNSLELDVDYETKCPASNVQLLLKAINDGDVDFFKNIIRRL